MCHDRQRYVKSKNILRIMAKNLLDPIEKEIIDLVEQHEEIWRYSEKILYDRCIKDMKKARLCEIEEKDVNGPVKTFLINWGQMGRVLGRENKEGWEKNLVYKLREICKELEKFRKLKLENTILSNHEDEIKKCYRKIRSTIGPVAATKVLHLLCPDFFPMWDNAIRKKISNECEEKSGVRIGDSEKGYYKYMEVIQGFVKRYNKILSNLNNKYKQSKLRIVDRYMWFVTRK